MPWFYNTITLLATQVDMEIDDEEFIAWVCKEADMPREVYDAIMFLSV